MERRGPRRRHAGGVHPADRARGRRGIDVEGHAAVVWAPGVDPATVAGLASTRTYPLRSSFRPSYNMAVNLVGSYGRERARELLASSFAQFQADRSVVGLARQAARGEEDAARLEAAVPAGKGDVVGYARLRSEISEREKELSRDTAARRRREAVETLRALRTGDVIRVPSGRRQGLAVVLDPGSGGDLDDPRPLVLTRTSGPVGWARSTSPHRSTPSPGCGCRRTSTTAARTPAASWPPPSATPGRSTSSAPGAPGPGPGRRRPGAVRPAPRAAPAPGARAARPRGAGAQCPHLAAGPPRRRAGARPDGRAHRLADPPVRPHLRRPRAAGLPVARGPVGGRRRG